MRHTKEYKKGKKITSYKDAMWYHADITEARLSKKSPPEDGNTVNHIEYFLFDGEKYKLDLTIEWTEDDIGELYLDIVDINSCEKVA